MQKSTGIKALFVLLTIACALSACNIGDLFSKSLADDSNRLVNATVGSAADAQRLLKLAKNDPAASRALLGKIAALAKVSSGAEKNALLGTAAVAAVQASNIGGLIITSAPNIDIDGLGSGDPAKYAEVVEDIANKAKANGAGGIAAELAGLPWEYAGNELSPTTVASMGATPAEQDSTLGLLALALVTGQMKSGVDLGQYIEEGSASGKDVLGDIFGISVPATGDVDAMIAANPSLKLLDAVVNSIGVDPKDPIAKGLKDMWSNIRG